ncbi:SMI1/KNR4 family protein [Streptomyces sp. NPDC001137]|uniref:SMI1/KNR4 family protein n=1 Tax=Streptomyces sp. NPDC001137 TaxID=3154378 RepID=UPI003323BD65
MSQVEEVVSAWERIVSWLRKRAPASAEALRPGASDEEIARLNEQLGFEIPAVLEIWLRLNNGSTAKDSAKPIPGGGIARLPHRDSIIFPGGMRFLGCKEIANRRAEYLHISQDIGDSDYWKSPWLPIMEKSDTPHGIILDAQNPHGSPLLKFREGDYPSFFLASLGDFLHPLSDLLETGEAPESVMEYERFSVAEGRICWTT